jgi:hypothetical protein
MLGGDGREEEFPGPQVAFATKSPYRPAGKLAARARDALLVRIWDVEEPPGRFLLCKHDLHITLLDFVVAYTCRTLTKGGWIGRSLARGWSVDGVFPRVRSLPGRINTTTS